MDESRGPFVSCACFCEKVLREQDGVISLVRVVDRFTRAIQVSDTTPPDQMPPAAFNMFLVITLKAGACQGTHPLQVVGKGPDGTEFDLISRQDVVFESPDRGINFVAFVTLTFEEQGVYWYSVRFGDNKQELTRIPLRFIKQYRQLPGK